MAAIPDSLMAGRTCDWPACAINKSAHMLKGSNVPHSYGSLNKLCMSEPTTRTSVLPQVDKQAIPRPILQPQHRLKKNTNGGLASVEECIHVI